MFCSLEPAGCSAATLARAHDVLADFPTEKRKLAPSPELAALPRRWFPSGLASEVVPMRLRPASSFEWKSSPYRMEQESAHPEIEYCGLDYLVAYWLYDSVCAARSDCPAR